MSLTLPVGSDILLSKDHALMHRILAVDESAPEQSLQIDSTGHIYSPVHGFRFPDNTIQNSAAVSSTEPSVSGSQYYSSKYTTTVTLDWDNGNVQYIVLANGGQTFTFSNGKDGGRYLLILKQPASSTAGTVTWPGTVAWSGASAPTLTLTNGQVDIITFVYDGTNTKYYGGFSLNY